MTSGDSTIYPLAALQAVHLQDSHLTDILRTELLPRCSADRLSLLTIAMADLGLQCQNRFDLEAVSVILPSGVPPPKEISINIPPGNASIYTSLSDIQTLELAHQFAITMVPDVLLCATAAPHGLPSLIRHILERVMAPSGGVALLGGIAERSGPLHAFLKATAPNFVDSAHLKCIISEYPEITIEKVYKKTVPLRAWRLGDFRHSLVTLGRLAAALTESAHACAIDSHCENVHIPEEALQTALNAAQQPQDGAVGIGLQLHMDYYVVEKKVSGEKLKMGGGATSG